MARVVFELAIPDGVVVEAEPLRFAGERVELDRTTACGWRYRVDEADGGWVARYSFLDHETTVRARGPRDAVLAVLASARPDWRGDDVIALIQLWEND